MDNRESALGAFLRDTAQDKGLSILQLSEATGISRTTLNRRIIDPDDLTLDELVKLAGVLETSPSDLTELYSRAAPAAA